MRTTLTLDDDIYHAAKALATTTGRSLGGVLSELARRALRPEPMGSEGGIPAFTVPRDAEIIPTDRASALLADEGLG